MVAFYLTDNYYTPTQLQAECDPNSVKTLDPQKILESLSLFYSGPQVSGRSLQGKFHSAQFRFEDDISNLFPYISSLCEGAQYSIQPRYIKFMLNGYLCLLHPRQGVFACVGDLNEAVIFLETLILFLHYAEQKKDKLHPDNRVYHSESPINIYKLLPGSNCNQCGYQTCLAFAAVVSRQYESLFNCPHLRSPVEIKSTFQVSGKAREESEDGLLSINTSFIHNQLKTQQSLISSLKKELAEYTQNNPIKIGKNNAIFSEPLTKREIDVLQLLTKGKTNKEISKTLYISENTVKTHISHIFDKLGVNDRTQASVWAVRSGFL